MIQVDLLFTTLVNTAIAIQGRVDMKLFANAGENIIQDESGHVIGTHRYEHATQRNVLELDTRLLKALMGVPIPGPGEELVLLRTAVPCLPDPKSINSPFTWAYEQGSAESPVPRLTVNGVTVALGDKLTLSAAGQTKPAEEPAPKSWRDQPSFLGSA